jgi:hypothetical protein
VSKTDTPDVKKNTALAEEEKAELRLEGWKNVSMASLNHHKVTS